MGAEEVDPDENWLTYPVSHSDLIDPPCQYIYYNARCASLPYSTPLNMTIDYEARPATGDHGDIDTKVAGFTEHEEKIDPVDNGSVQVVSQYVGLGKLATVRRFWLVCLYCVLVAFGKDLDT